MAARINKSLFDESKIIKKDVIPLISEITSEESVIRNSDHTIDEKKEQPDISVDKNAIKPPKTTGKNLSDKSKEYLNIIENEEKKNKKIVKPPENNVEVSKIKPHKIDNNEQFLFVQEAQLMLESTKKNIIKTKIEIQIYKELYQSEYNKEDKALYETKLKLLGKDLNYFEKRKNIIETIINNEISQR